MRGHKYLGTQSDRKRVTLLGPLLILRPMQTYGWLRYQIAVTFVCNLSLIDTVWMCACKKVGSYFYNHLPQLISVFSSPNRRSLRAPRGEDNARLGRLNRLALCLCLKLDGRSFGWWAKGALYCCQLMQMYPLLNFAVVLSYIMFCDITLRAAVNPIYEVTAYHSV